MKWILYTRSFGCGGTTGGGGASYPGVDFRSLDEVTGNTVFLKCENFQRMGAFKFRGAYNAISRLSPAAAARGVITYSSGNHAQAVALAGRLLGVKRQW